MTRKEHPSPASSHTAAPQDRGVDREGNLGSVLCPRGQQRHSSKSQGFQLKRSQTSKYANSLIQHLSTYLKLDSFLSAFMSGSQDNKGTQQIRSFSPGLKSTATSARTRQQPSSNSWSSFPSHVSQAARASKFAALVTSMLVLVAPSCQPGPVTPLLFILNECIHEYKKEGVTHLSEKMERTFSFWIFNYQLSVSLRRKTHTSSLSGS